MQPPLLAPPVRSQLDTRAPEFRENREAMLEKLAEIESLLDEAELGGGAHHHERLAKRGKLPVRERIAPSRPCVIGLPGRIAIRQKAMATPSASSAVLTRSWSPTDAPPVVTRMSASTSRARRMPAVVAASVAAATPPVSTRNRALLVAP